MKLIEIDEEEDAGALDHGRRGFLAMLPVAVFGAIAVAFATVAKRSLGAPLPAVPPVTPDSAGNWKHLGAIAELESNEPIVRSVTVERTAGWAKTVEDQVVFVLPQHDHRVLSSVCPHEGCPVLWEADRKNFLCPCHDSFFSDAGVRLSGPAQADLTQLPTRVQDGNLQIKMS